MPCVRADRAACIGSAARCAAQTPAAITVTSPTLKANETIPKDHTADGKNVSPALTWSGAPAGTKQFALVCDDPGRAVRRQTFVHWVVYKIPAPRRACRRNCRWMPR